MKEYCYLSLLLVLLSALPLSGQVRYTVVDEASDIPVEGVLVLTFARDSMVMDRTLSLPDGTFEITSPDFAFISLRHLQYETRTLRREVLDTLPGTPSS